MHARPGKAGPADADAVTQRSAVLLHEIEHALVGVDDDGACCFRAAIGNLLLLEARIHHEIAGLCGRFDHPRAEIRRIRTIGERGGLRGLHAAHQEFDEPAAILALRGGARRHEHG